MPKWMLKKNSSSKAGKGHSEAPMKRKKSMSGKSKEISGDNFFVKISPLAEKKLSALLRKLFKKKVGVKFKVVKTLVLNNDEIEIKNREKVYGTYTKISGIEGVIAVLFPERHIKALLNYVDSSASNKDHDYRLSTFKEICNIITYGYISILGDELDEKINGTLPQLVCFKSIKLKESISDRIMKASNLVTLGKFGLKNIEGRLLVYMDMVKFINILDKIRYRRS
jgi:chemotaxis protein CheY-P-specific phosphatase CheC